MTGSSTHLVFLILLLLVALLLALLTAVTAALLARWDGSSLPASLLRAGVAFGGTLTVLAALIALLVHALP
ncbi:hypothetical protein DEJ51_34115 [Streptomyces venezuelae]|uniref:Uncharacterized protein n=1 Tax=Streptomyces venezuelae TaxID=54571 RepID=A0A5P2DTM1_STRVZ|nr:hypothetical protein [Streptomyces venezuelae]QES58542.1 hypothetical protein DEJ51_34115 [Streptomyces venezuelae]